MFRNRKAYFWQNWFAWLVLGIVILAIGLRGYFILKDRGINAIEFAKNLFRFRRAG